ncbi:MAG TPA: 2OG-Fe(II) oxygenase [Rhizomicrobium sp.]|nr:2OG-Fe(II) oxygenase [Rhizomicrobium sp.]
MSDANAVAQRPPYAFAPQAGQTSWWSGDPLQFPYHYPGDRHRHFITRVELLSPAQCRVLIDCFERCREDYAARAGGAYWSGRFIWQNDLPNSEIDAIRIVQQLRCQTLNILNQAILPDEPLYSDTAQLVRWHEGIELPPHVDNMEPDGRPNPSPHRSFSSVLYLNDDYEGGETYFPGHKIRIKPSAGSLIVFGAGPEYVHGITRVTRGLRYTYAGWFTYDKRLEDPNASKVF